MCHFDFFNALLSYPRIKWSFKIVIIFLRKCDHLLKGAPYVSRRVRGLRGKALRGAGIWAETLQDEWGFQKAGSWERISQTEGLACAYARGQEHAS